ncbi:hypothetical protein [Pantoea agglomerans]|uniref:hypothetical protein n=1 Tax=Enterobacter agglomerans TaxID=549 RepID=UPI001CCF10C6|nr:hypothetical protein [Pantoea agglomerans]UBN55274.1 hypothetical protein LB453_06860 [Pantoea agglomerans]
MAKPVINFENAQFEQCGRVSNIDANGVEKNVRHNLRIILADGTIYAKEWPRFHWAKWMVNKDHIPYSITSRRGHYRKCNDRHTWLLDQAWKANFKETAHD